MNRKIWALLSLAALTSLTLVATTTSSSAAGAPDPIPATSKAASDSLTDISPGQIAAMQRDLKLTRSQVRDRLDLESGAGVIERKLAKSLGSDYAGTWIAVDGKSVVVGITDATRASAVRAAGGVPKLVRNSSKSLNTAKTSLDTRAKSKASSAKGVSTWFADPVTNQVIIEATSVKVAAAFAASAGLSTADYTVEVNTDVPVPVADLVGGAEFRKPTGGGGYTLCSIGIPVKQGGFITAGHCGSGGESVTSATGAALGTYQSSAWPNKDYAWVKTNSSWTAQPLITQWNGSSSVVAGWVEAPVGASVCRSGRTTQWKCGVIEAKNVSWNGGLITDGVRGSACANSGDSGGSVISGNQAQGVTSAKIGECGSGGAFIYQPLQGALNAYGLDVKTTGVAIKGSHSGRCIDVPSSNYTTGVQLQIYNCNRTNAQNWTFASDGTVRVNGLCMDLRWAWTHDGAEIQLMNCNGHAAQKFTFNSAGDLVSNFANKCVDVKDVVSANGGLLQIWTCTGASNQKWSKVD